LAVRDYLRVHAKVAAAYSALKKRLAEMFPDDIDGYVDGKSSFLLAILREAGVPPELRSDIKAANRRPKTRIVPSMKRLLKYAVMVWLILIAMRFFLDFAIAARRMVRDDSTEQNIHWIAVYVETFRQRNERYPTSIVEVISDALPESQQYINDVILHDQWNHHYELEVHNDSFSILVTMPKTRFSHPDVIRRDFKKGEALE
jgi:hypothetical protein